MSELAKAEGRFPAVEGVKRSLDGIAAARVDAMGEMPWTPLPDDSPALAEAKAGRRSLEIAKCALGMAEELGEAAEALTILYHAEVARLAAALGPFAAGDGTPGASYDGTEAGLMAILSEALPERADTGDARGKLQFVRDAVPALVAAGIDEREIALAASRTSMRPRLASAVSGVLAQGFEDPAPHLRKAVEDAQALTTREFDREWRDPRIDLILFDEERVGGTFRRVYPTLSPEQRAAISSALRGREERADMPMERALTLSRARHFAAAGDWRSVIVAVLPVQERAVLEAVENHPGTEEPSLRSLLGLAARTLARSLSVLADCGLVAANSRGYRAVPEGEWRLRDNV